MSTIRSRDTQPELALRRALHRLGIRGWRCHTRDLPGKPDVAFTRWKVAIFVDGAFWHGHPDHFAFGRSGPYWDQKIARTQDRDRAANTQLAEMGWTVLRFWDFEIREEFDSCVDRVLGALEQAGRDLPDRPQLP
jgi:DNA mismatch endonuclease (patch repair protein)